MLACSRGGGRGLQSKHVCSTPASCGAMQPREERRQCGLQAPNTGSGWTGMISAGISRKLMLTCAWSSPWSVVLESHLPSHRCSVWAGGCWPWLSHLGPYLLASQRLLSVFSLQKHNLRRNSQETVHLLCQLCLNGHTHTHPTNHPKYITFFLFCFFGARFSWLSWNSLCRPSWR